MRTRLLLVTIVVLVVVGLLAGCGGSGKPSYCSKRTNLENSIKDLSNLNVSSGLSGLQAQLQKVQSDANALVSSAKGDFPVQTNAIKTSIDSLVRSVKAVTSTPSAAQIATVASDASTVVSSVKSFVDATSSKC
jgi:predicted PurR-regulated permease PerM